MQRPSRSSSSTNWFPAPRSNNSMTTKPPLSGLRSAVGVGLGGTTLPHNNTTPHQSTGRCFYGLFPLRQGVIVINLVCAIGNIITLCVSIAFYDFSRNVERIKLLASLNNITGMYNDTEANDTTTNQTTDTSSTITIGAKDVAKIEMIQFFIYGSIGITFVRCLFHTVGVVGVLRSNTSMVVMCTMSYFINAMLNYTNWYGVICAVALYPHYLLTREMMLKDSSDHE
jgi:hypothetical protein